MFRINAFGRRIYCNPYLRFVDPPEGGNAGQGGGQELPPEPPKPSESDKGFPDATPVAEMSTEQQLAYHRYHSRKHESGERELQRRQADFDKFKADSAELTQLKTANATAEEKALEDARREGENIGAERYLKDAVKGRFQGITGKPDDEVNTIFEHVDPSTFTNDQGDIDAEKLRKYADTFGKPDTGGDHDPIADALARQRQAGGGSGSSISEKRKEVRESMTRKSA